MNEIQTPIVTDTFYRPCLICGETIHTTSGIQDPHECKPLDSDPDNQRAELIARAWWAGHDAALENGIAL